jgi:hypothetical protein
MSENHYHTPHPSGSPESHLPSADRRTNSNAVNCQRVRRGRREACGESKRELTDRLRADGRWPAFIHRREELKARGMSAAIAWRMAAAEFPPLVAGPAVNAAAGTEATGRSEASTDVPPAPGRDQDALDPAPSAITAAPPLSAQGPGTTGSTTVTTADLPPGDQKTDLDALRQAVSPIVMLDAIAWVFENLDNEDAKPLYATSAGAWSLLKWARSSAMNRSEFYRVFVPRLLPARPPTIEPTRFGGDDGRGVQATIDRLLKQCELGD